MPTVTLPESQPAQPAQPLSQPKAPPAGKTVADADAPPAEIGSKPKTQTEPAEPEEPAEPSTARAFGNALKRAIGGFVPQPGAAPADDEPASTEPNP